MTFWKWSWWLNVWGSSLHFYSVRVHGALAYQIFHFTTVGLAFCVFKNFATSLKDNHNAELIRAEQDSNNGNWKVSDQAAVWLFYATNSQHLFQGIRALSEPLQVRSSQADCISFCAFTIYWITCHWSTT